MTHLDGYLPSLQPGWKPFKMIGHLCICAETKSVFFFFSSCYSRYRTRPVCCVSDNRPLTWPQPQPEFIIFREDSIQRPSRISGSLPVCDVVLESWETLGRFIHSRLNISVSGWHGNRWCRRYIRTLYGKLFHTQEFYFNANSNCKWIDILNFFLCDKH